MKKICMLTSILLCIAALAAPAAANLNIVSTTSVLANPLKEIGGDRVTVVTVTDAGLCPDSQADVIGNLIQVNQDFIRNADLYVAHNSSMDRTNVMPYVDKFMTANNFGTVNWTTPKNPNQDWNTPASALALVGEEKGWLEKADPVNTSYYEANYQNYTKKFAAANLTPAENTTIRGQDVVAMVWQKNAATDWLGLNVVTVFAPEFYRNGSYTPAKIVDDINANPGKYRNVSYVIENMQSTEMAKGIEEALRAKGINATRVVFTNFPGSVPGVNSIPEVLVYNKGLVTPAPVTGAALATSAPSITKTPEPGTTTPLPAGASTAVPTAAKTTKSPLGAVLVISSVAAAIGLLHSRKD